MELKKMVRDSVRVSGVVAACSSRHGGRESVIDMTDVVRMFDGSYAINNSTVCFVFTWYRSLPHYVMAHLVYHWNKNPKKK